MLVEVPLDGSFPIDEGDGGVVAGPVYPQGEGLEVDVVVSNVLEGGVDGGKLEGAAVLGEVTLCLVGGVVLAHRDAVVSQCLGGLLNVRLERHCQEGQGAGERAEAEYNKEFLMRNPLEVDVGV